MTLEQLTDIVLKQTSDVAALSESSKSAHKRIDENDRMIEGIHKLAANVELLAMQVKMLTERMEASIERMESALKGQGERIGRLESEPAHKWKALAAQVTSCIIAAGMGVIIARFI